MELGSESASIGAERARGIEQCECPLGYAGLSCEECAFGYVRRHQQPSSPSTIIDAGQQQQLGECVACHCHGHAETCLATDLTACSSCLHNTTGAQCQQCSVGFYGDARTGAVDACRKCYCPLAVESNNFSPTCHSAAPPPSSPSDDYGGVGGYVCDRCPVGHEGQHCERFVRSLVRFFTARLRAPIWVFFFQISLFSLFFLWHGTGAPRVFTATQWCPAPAVVRASATRITTWAHRDGAID